jgi:hypothetical protein
MQRTQIRLNQNPVKNISSEFDFGRFGSRSLRFSGAVNVLNIFESDPLRRTVRLSKRPE